MIVADRIRDANIWWLFSELCRRAPMIRLRGVGLDPTDPVPIRPDLGSMPLIVLDHGPQERELIESMLCAERAEDAVARWAGAVHAEPHPVGPTQLHMLTYRVLAETLERNVMRSSRVRVQWAAPALSRPDLGLGGLVNDHFGATWGPFGASAEHVYKRMHEYAPGSFDPLDTCWVVTVDGRPVLLVDEGGWAHDPLGAHANLARTFSGTHSVSAVYDKVIARAIGSN